MTMTLIETKVLGAAAASIEFTSIPQDGTDLFVLASLRMDANAVGVIVSFNTGGSYTRRRLIGNGSTASSDTFSNDLLATTSVATSNTFSNNSLYIPNYTGSTTKSYSTDNVTENNGTTAIQAIYAGLWDQTAAITYITLTPLVALLVTGSTVSLYKITKGSSGGVVVS